MAAQDYEQVTYNSPTGAQVGQSSTEKIGFFGATPVTKPANTLTTAAISALTTSAVCAMSTTQLQTLQTTVNGLVLSVQALGLNS